ncbi:MAG: universal stress protein [Bacteroidales bacterium]|jgi:nucleotide-binding universal stress UspA family protein|nr:universal stress protein [Flavobacterium piscis]HOK37265.1 universal stress protein [Bacteroidales bacterium]HOL96898.1 universal stress protein [Bacteroidales bacterium]HPD25050.1 universal stress protein [Bacteroidales bacterium]HRS98455.1 universal stress protein [Bacteroidales bacterium]
MKNKNVQNILIYTDFTELGDNSIEWGIFLAKKFKRKIHLIHVINENSYVLFNKENVLTEVKNELEKLSLEIIEKYNIECDYFFDEGCTCTIINSTAERIDAFLIVVGNHGKNDPQFLSGSALVKIIRKSRIPYFVIQKKTKSPEIMGDIVIPIDARKEMKEKTGWVTYFAKNCGNPISIIADGLDDPKIDNNIKFCSNFFDKYSLKYQIQKLTKSSWNIDKSVLKIIDNENTFCMSIITTKNENLFNKIFGLPETDIISNNKSIPVLCINPKKDLYIPCL